MVEINPFSALSSIGQAAKDRVSIADDFDTFLSLLTAQLQNQNPLDPLDMNQFTQQLVQFTEVEQSVKLNKNLEQIVQLSAANTITNMVSFLGDEVTLDGKTAELNGGSATWDYTADGNADGAIFTVLDSSGVPVFSRTESVAAGTGRFSWNGATNTGSVAPGGTYTLSIAATNSSGVAVNIATETVGIVQGVDLSGDEPVLLVNGREIRLDQIRSVKLPATGTAATQQP